MQTNEQRNQAVGLNLADIYYIIFRHKWKIITLSAAGFVAAGVVYFAMPLSYSSEAKLFVRYVLESRLPTGLGGDPQVKSPDPGGANIINSEIEIIKSLDLAVQVADAIGPDKILGSSSTYTNRFDAARLLQKNLIVDVPRNSDIMRIVFQHPNRDIVQPVLTQLIDGYLRKHVEIHRSVGTFDDVLTQQTDALKNQLAETEAELRRAKTNSGILSIEDSKKAYTEELSKIREQLFNAQAELAERQATFDERQKLSGKTETPSNRPEADVPPDKIEEYKSVSARLELLRKKEQELLVQFTPENSWVRANHEQLTVAEDKQKKLEAEYPRLTKIQLPSSKPGGPVMDLADEAAHITALQVKLKVLNSQLEKLNSDARLVGDLEPEITGLQRKRDLEETKYRHFSTSLEQARFDVALGAGKTSNINIVQNPTLPARESRQLIKTLSAIAIGGVVAGFALAFLIELVLDPTVRRSNEVTTRMRLPLFLTIPKIAHSSRALPALPAASEGVKPGTARSAEPSARSESKPVQWNPNGLGSYYEALRDRLVTFFEIKNLTHKPKLIALTGCGRGTGVTTLAAGLAASLSETGDGNVLLVDMTSGEHAAHPFFKGRPGCQLADALGTETRSNALVKNNLYAVSEGGGQLPRVLPRRFNSLVPQLKASDYDYIIFDMPAVSQISSTPRLARFMDIVLLVIESEKTDREAAERATAMLTQSNAEVGVVLNKTQRYVPKRLQQDL